jgi:hypothetical protein
MACALLYGALWIVSRASEPDLARMAVVRGLEPGEGLDPRVRGTEPLPPDAPAEQLLARAFVLADRARTSFLGLFPRYDASLLREAEGLLDRVVASGPEDPVLREQAGGGRRAAAAAALLVRLDATTR